MQHGGIVVARLGILYELRGGRKIRIHNRRAARGAEQGPRGAAMRYHHISGEQQIRLTGRNARARKLIRRRTHRADAKLRINPTTLLREAEGVQGAHRPAFQMRCLRQNGRHG